MDITNEDNEETADYHQIASNSDLPELLRFTYCSKCRQVKPPRSFHCGIACDFCAVRSDHHCVWVGNVCVSLRNHKFFILYLGYLTIALQCSCLPFYSTMSSPLGIFELIEIRGLAGTFLFFYAFALSLGLALLFILQVKLATNAQTMYEWALNYKSAPFGNTSSQANDNS